MKKRKSLYSLILMDDVVRKIDDAAYRQGTSRSGLVNSILAGYVGLETPQQRAGELFDALARAAEEGGALVRQQRSALALALSSALQYRYNPTIRYQIELEEAEDGWRCTFRASSRTRSEGLLSRLTVFYEMWSQIERFLHRDRSPIRATIKGGVFCRELAVDAGGAPALMGRAAARYILLFDKALKLSFAAGNAMNMQTFEEITTLYKGYLAEAELVV